MELADGSNDNFALLRLGQDEGNCLSLVQTFVMYHPSNRRLLLPNASPKPRPPKKATGDEAQQQPGLTDNTVERVGFALLPISKPGVPTGQTATRRNGRLQIVNAHPRGVGWLIGDACYMTLTYASKAVCTVNAASR